MENRLEIPKPVLSTKPTVLTILNILLSYDPDKMEKAKTKYRKPSYQRTQSREKSWCVNLVESIIEGKHIGSLTLSSWTTITKDNSGRQVIEGFYNVEDGQTRLDALKRFKQGEYSTKYGNYDNLKNIFDSYSLSITEISKADFNITDSEYFEELNENFSRLQDGRDLKVSDRYWAWCKDEDNNFAGSPLINYSLEIFSEFEHDFKETMNVDYIKKDHRYREHITGLVSLVSGSLWGSEYSNRSYFKHVPVINKDISNEVKEDCRNKLRTLFTIIKRVYSEKIAEKGEPKKTMFFNGNKITPLIIEDLHMGSIENEKWVSVINEYRDNKDFFDSVFEGLSDGQRRNYQKKDISLKLDKINEWWNENSNN